MEYLVSIIIVNWNACDHLRKCLQSILHQGKKFPLEVFVIDNASQDDSVNTVKREFPDVHLIANNENRGFAAGNNQGLALAKGRYILLLNPDTILLDDALEKSINVAAKNPEVGVIGCQVLERRDKIQKTCFSFPTPLNLLLLATGLPKIFPKSRYFGKPELSWWDRRSERFVDVVSGMFMLVRREAIEEVGFMDEAYFIYAEEADWCFRFWRKGWPCMFTPEARIIHTEGGGQSTRKVAVRMYVQLQKSLLIFNRKNIGIYAWLAAKAVFIISNFFRVIVWGPVAVFSQRARHKTNRAFAGLCFQLTGSEPKISPARIAP